MMGAVSRGLRARSSSLKPRASGVKTMPPPSRGFAVVVVLNSMQHVNWRPVLGYEKNDSAGATDEKYEKVLGT